MGDEAALAALYDRWVTLVHSVAIQLLEDSDDAAEVVEEVFWQVWRQPESYQAERSAVSTWLAMITRSRALDRQRSRTRRRRRETELPEDEAQIPRDSTSVDPLDGAEAAERSEIVALAIWSLPTDQRQTIELAYFRGMSQSEIAKHTGQPLGTVKTRVRLAFQKLRETLSILRDSVQ
ncbi:MAG: sigma-70 family RNA polymerase sigma factor [Longimicrobiaceae bacterium]